MFDIDELIVDMTLEEKASLCSGKGFWNTKSIVRLELPSITMNDGPHGLRKPEEENESYSQSLPSTCFPTYSALGNSWDTELVHQVGGAIADEALEKDVSVILGPGVNIKRSPLCGRNFEYLSEDPYLSGEMGAAFIDGVQSKGVGTSLKHFAVNNQESRRMLIDAVVDERALREIYLTAFEKAVKQSAPWTVMTAYNKLGGTYCTENAWLNDILRDEWGFDGINVTDWGACNDRLQGLKAGQDLEMPGNEYNDAKIVDAVKSGALSMDVLDTAVRRILRLVHKSLKNKRSNYTCDKQKNHELARKACAQSCILLKNDDVLPLNKDCKIAVIGELAAVPHIQGGGSSKINPSKSDTPLEAFLAQGAAYAKGYDIKRSSTDKALKDEAAEAAKKADAAIVFAGYTDVEESEGFDKKSLDLPTYMNETVRAVAKANANTIVVLQNGSPISMPWLNEVKGVLECYLAGQASGKAVYDIITGKVNPSGRLAETFPLALSDNPSYQWFPGGPGTVEYRESVYVGYRYYDTANKQVLFPFGFGLSYTTFKYASIALTSNKIDAHDELTVTIEVKNTGKVRGAEVVQLYVCDEQSTVFRPRKELKAFKKIWLDAGETGKVEVTLDKRSFAYYNVAVKDWHVETGTFLIEAGSSSADIHLKAQVFVQSEQAEIYDYRDSAPEYYDLSSHRFSISDESFSALLGKDIPNNETQIKRPFDLNSTIVDLRQVLIGRIMFKVFAFMAKKADVPEFVNNDIIMMQVQELPLRSLVAMSGGMVSAIQIEGILQMANGKFFKGLKKVIRNK